MTMNDYGYTRLEALLYLKDHSYEETAKKFDVSISTINNWRKELLGEEGRHMRGVKRNRDNVQKIQEFICKHPELSQIDVAKHFGVTRQYISQTIARYNMPYKCKKSYNTMRNYISSIRKQVIEDLEKNPTTTYLELAKKYNVHQNYISEIAHSIGYKYYRHRFDVDKCINMLNANVKKKEIAKQLGVSYATIRQFVSQLNYGKGEN